MDALTYALLRQVDKNGRAPPDLEHVASGQPVFSQQRNELKNLCSYDTSKVRAIPEVFAPLDEEERCQKHEES